MGEIGCPDRGVLIPVTIDDLDFLSRPGDVSVLYAENGAKK